MIKGVEETGDANETREEPIEAPGFAQTRSEFGVLHGSVTLLPLVFFTLVDRLDTPPTS